MCSIRGCSLENFENSDKCILHCEKEEDTWYDILDSGKKDWQKSKDRIYDFWNEFENNNTEDIYSMIVPPINNYKFEIPDFYIGNNSIVLDDLKFGRNNKLNQISFFNTEFNGSVKIQNSLDNKGSIFLCDVKNLSSLNVNIHNAKVHVDINLTELKSLNLNSGEKGIYSNSFGEIKIYNSNIRRLKFDNSTFTDRVNIYNNTFYYATFNNCDFEEKVELKVNTFKRATFFKNTRFFKLYDCYSSSFNFINFLKTTFEDISVFTSARFKKNVNFKYTTFNKMTIFRDAIFEKEIDLKDSVIKDKSNFLDISKDKKRFVDVNVSNRETARIIKDSFEQENNIIEANKFYALEMKERDKEVKWKTDFSEKLVFKFHGISSNHSQDWILALFWILNITFGFFITEKSYELFGNTFISYIPILVLIILGITNSFLPSMIRTTFIVILTFLNYGIFRIISDDNSLDSVANKINPFSIMTKGEDLDFPTMIYKIIIAYLIYQLIISIRQNTRRK